MCGCCSGKTHAGSAAIELDQVGAQSIRDVGLAGAHEAQDGGHNGRQRMRQNDTGGRRSKVSEDGVRGQQRGTSNSAGRGGGGMAWAAQESLHEGGREGRW